MKAKLWGVTMALVGLVVTSAPADVSRETARFTSEDGIELVADYYPAEGLGAAPAVILLHIYHSDRSAWRPLVPKLHEAGFAVLALDMRGHGESTRPESMNLRQRVEKRDPALFNDMHKDVAAAYVWLARQPQVDRSQLGLVGASVGCSVSLAYAVRDKSVDAVVCLTPGANYLGVDSVKDMKQIGSRPVLLLATEDERQDSDALGQLNPAAEVRIVGRGTVHGTQMLGKMAGIEDQIVAYLNEHIRSAEKTPVAASLNGREYFAVGSEQDIKLDPKERRLFSSIEEARARGLAGPDSPLNGRMIDTNDPKERPERNVLPREGTNPAPRVVPQEKPEENRP